MLGESKSRSNLRPSSFLSSSHAQSFTNHSSFLTTAAKPRLDTLGAALQYHDETRAQLEVEVEILSDRLKFTVFTWSVAAVEAGLTSLAYYYIPRIEAAARQKISDLSVSKYDEVVKSLFGDDGYKADPRTGKRVVLTLEELISKEGIYKVKNSKVEMLKRIFKEVRSFPDQTLEERGRSAPPVNLRVLPRVGAGITQKFTGSMLMSCSTCTLQNL